MQNPRHVTTIEEGMHHSLNHHVDPAFKSLDDLIDRSINLNINNIDIDEKNSTPIHIVGRGSFFDNLNYSNHYLITDPLPLFEEENLDFSYD